MNPRQFDLFVIRPVLDALAPEVKVSEAARRLLLGTAMHESGGLTYIDQVTGAGDVQLGPAYGLFQIEPATHDDLFKNFLRFRPALEAAVLRFAASSPSHIHQLATNMAYATAIARMIYFRAPGALPDGDDLEGLAAYWKQYYNTPLGKGTPAQWLMHYPKGL
jgi:hypothetical protein